MRSVAVLAFEYAPGASRCTAPRALATRNFFTLSPSSALRMYFAWRRATSATRSVNASKKSAPRRFGAPRPRAPNATMSGTWSSGCHAMPWPSGERNSWTSGSSQWSRNTPTAVRFPEYLSVSS